MAAANAVYYASSDPLGAAGDFITAPEISQIFGELIGLWFADLAIRANAANSVAYVELGPGRGTLAVDAFRAMGRAGLTPDVHLVETSPTLRACQRDRLPTANWHDSIDSLPGDRPLIVIANEFFDALPVRQYERTARGWRERMVASDPARFVCGSDDCASAIPIQLAEAPLGSIVEANPAAEAISAALSQRLHRQGGAILCIDYGYEGPATGDTLQAMKAHQFVDPLEEPGARDLTAHVDFAMLATIGRDNGLRPSPCVGQGDFLRALGIEARAATLARANPARIEELRGAVDRLVSPSQMGKLFRVLAMRHPAWPQPAGFA